MIKYCKDYFDDINLVEPVIPNIELLRDKSVLITGCTGLICSSVADILLHLNKTKMNITIYLAGRNFEKIKKRFNCYIDGEDYKYIKYDATEDIDVNVQVDYIIHGASNASPQAYIKEPVETMLANIIGLNSLMKAAVKAKSQRVLYISSSEVYGNKNNSSAYLEDEYGFIDILNMRASYPSSKRAAETLCVAYGYEYGVDSVMVRPGHVYGPAISLNDSRASAEFTRRAANGDIIVMKSKGDQLRSYCYCLDCASAIITVLLNGKNNSAYNISNRDSVCTISDVAHTFAKEAGVDIIYEEPSNVETKGYNLMTNSSLDSTKLEKLGWKAIFNLDIGVRKTLEYYY